MDLVEISYNDNAQLSAETIPGGEVFIVNDYLLDPPVKFTKNNDLKIRDTFFTVGDNYIELYDGKFSINPELEHNNLCSGSYKTQVLKIPYNIIDGKLEGKMCIRNVNEKCPLYTKYEISIKRAKMDMIIGIKYILSYNHCIYKFSEIDISFSFYKNSEMLSVFDSMITDINERKLLETYLMEYVTVELPYELIKRHEEYSSKYRPQLLDTYVDVTNYNIIRVHNKILHKAFQNLADKIIKLTHQIMEEESYKLTVNKLFGIACDAKDEKILKVFEGYICNLNSIVRDENADVIISEEGKFLVIDVPVKLKEFTLHYRESIGKEDDALESSFSQIQSFGTIEDYFCISLERLSEEKVGIELRAFKIANIRSLLQYEMKMVMDYRISYALEESIKPFLKKALAHESLQKLAIYQDVDIEYSCEDVNVNDEIDYSSNEEFEDLQTDDEEF